MDQIEFPEDAFELSPDLPQPSARGSRSYLAASISMARVRVDFNIATWQYDEMAIELETGLKALANDRRLQIMEWLKDPTTHFRPQVDGDLVQDGVCGLLITEKLEVSQPTASEHLRVLTSAGFLTGKKIKQWVFYKRDEKEIAAFKALLKKQI
ncbi:MAG TPA: metalloregulator ArsR/SmtB family transcription factor [Steroidobacter sp.]